MKPKLHIVSFSGGKDSTAMLCRMKELGMKIDIVLYCDTTVEFPAMYEHVDKVEKFIDMPITRLRNEQSFEHLLLHHVKTTKSGDEIQGYSFPGIRQRWCTSKLKVDVIKKFVNQFKDKYEVIEYVGLAADEEYRLERKNNKHQEHPLVDWGWTEEQALKYCYEKGFDFGGLYEIFPKVSCWCCPLQSLTELRKLRKTFPELWATLQNWQHQTYRKFRFDFSADELEKRFALEDDRISKGLTINSKTKEFRQALKDKLEEK